jgi:hypothetical protein
MRLSGMRKRRWELQREARKYNASLPNWDNIGFPTDQCRSRTVVSV